MAAHKMITRHEHVSVVRRRRMRRRSFPYGKTPKEGARRADGIERVLDVSTALPGLMGARRRSSAEKPGRKEKAG